MTRREIGSEFWDVPISDQQNKLFPESTQWFLSGRGALQAIIKEVGVVRSVSLPSWCCDSMIKPFVDAGIEVHFYPVYWQNGLIQEIYFNSDVLFLIDYFGHTSQRVNTGDYKGIVIRDVTHTIFSSTYDDADYFFGSLRKWCGIWTGGYAWTRDGHKLNTEPTCGNEYITLRKNAMQQKAEYICGARKDKAYLRTFENAEELLDSIEPLSASERDVQIVKKLDVKTIKSKRRANAAVLQSAFPDWLILPEQSSNDVPMFVPVLVPNGKRDELRRYLIKNEIYCPVHWPVSEYHRLKDRERVIYDNELSLVCDQRYSEDDMRRMTETVNTFWKKV